MAGNGRLKATVSVTDMPEVLAAMRREMAWLLRDEAARQEDTVVGWAVQRSLLAVAAAFEAGLSREDLEQHRA